MDIIKYEKLTGLTVAEADKPAITAQIRRTKSKLEAMLGYSLTKKTVNEYEEKGKNKNDCDFYGIINDAINDEDLDPADEVIGSYRLFPYDPRDRYFMTDPFIRVHAVKLVALRVGEDPNGITHKTFSEHRVRVEKGGNTSKYIERCPTCLCSCRCDETCLQLAVDADWLNEDCLPDELMYIWADMVTYYNDCNVDVKSETLGTHRYEKFDRGVPQELSENVAILKKYAGPHGSLFDQP